MSPDVLQVPVDFEEVPLSSALKNDERDLDNAIMAIVRNGVALKVLLHIALHLAISSIPGQHRDEIRRRAIQIPELGIASSFGSLREHPALHDRADDPVETQAHRCRLDPGEHRGRVFRAGTRDRARGR
jgi:hypothetical protein